MLSKDRLKQTSEEKLMMLVCIYEQWIYEQWIYEICI